MTNKRFPSIAVLSATMILFVTGARADSYTSDQLLNMGQKAWNQERCVQAAEYFFAYQQMNPPALQNDAAHRHDVAGAIQWCEQNATVSAGSKADGPGADPVGAPKQPEMKNLSPAVPTALDRRCDIYARLAVAQNDANAANHCSLTGNRWRSDYQYHYSWCTDVPSGDTRNESLARTGALNSCTP